MPHWARVLAAASGVLAVSLLCFVVGLMLRIGVVAAWYGRWPRWRDEDDGLLLLAAGWVFVTPALLIVSERSDGYSTRWLRWTHLIGGSALVGMLSTSPLMFYFGARTWSSDVNIILFQGACCGMLFAGAQHLLARSAGTRSSSE